MKLSKYNWVNEMDYGLLVYNFKSGKGFKIKNSSPDDILHFRNICSGKIVLSLDDNMVKTLYDMKFIVDDYVDEFSEVKKHIDKILNCPKDFLNIVLHVTDNCNFRCVYCFKKAKPQNFSDKNWNNLYKYIKHKFEKEGLKDISIHFYGGEPLLRYNKIIEFMEKANSLTAEKKDRNIYYAMTTNGYLLTKKRYNILTSLGLDYFQITLDGFAEQHDKSRPMVDGRGTWSKIVENLKYINSVEDNVDICIRMNYNSDNLYILDKYKLWIAEIFNNKKMRLSLNPVQAYSSLVKKNLLADVTKRELQSYDTTIEENNKNFEDSLQIGSHVCKYAYNHHVTISSKGLISLCEECDLEDTIIGYLGDNGKIIYSKNINAWLDRFEDNDCKDCLMYPLCGAKSCLKKKKCGLVKQRLEQKLEDIKNGKISLM